MTNFPDSGLDDLSPPDDVAAQKLSVDLRSLIEVQPDALPNIDFGRVARVAGAPRRLAPRGWRIALVGATAAAVALFLTSGAGLLSHGTPAVSAQAILDRTQTAADTYAPADQDVSYHLVATSTTTGSRPTTTETWWADTQHFKTEVLDPDGQVLSEQVRSGNDFWIVSRVDGQLKSAHTTLTDSNLRISVGSLSGAGVSFAIGGPDMLKGGCGAPVSSGTDEVASRSTYVIKMPTQADSACGPVFTASTDGKGAGMQSRSQSITGDSGLSLTGAPPEGASGVRVAGIAMDVQTDDATAYRPQGPIDVTLWVDQATFITLKSEARDATGNVFNTYEVSTFDVGVTPPASTFEKPAADQTVEANSMEDLLPALMGN